MKHTTLVLGGCRSGKSRFALQLAQKTAPSDRLFFATSVPRDPEMRDRVRRHQKERGEGWETVEVPTQVSAAIRERSRSARVILVDCVTLWLSNLLLETEDTDGILDSVRELAETISDARCPVILVSNEVGMGIVPENRLARLFRDVAGSANQMLAEVSDSVVWVAAGIPVTLKGGVNR